MKIAITAGGNNLDAPMDPRFGRASCFIIYDAENGQFQAVDNAQNLNAAQGAGIQAAETIARTGATHLITGHCGPKAFRALLAAGIQVYNIEADTVRTALDLFKAGQLKPAQSADVDGHW